VYGYNLAAAHPFSVFAIFRGVPLPVRSVSHSELRVVLPPGHGVGHPFFVSINGRNTSALTLKYGRPVITGFVLDVRRLRDDCLLA
jgi:hypothetical protein